MNKRGLELRKTHIIIYMGTGLLNGVETNWLSPDKHRDKTLKF